MCMCFCRYGCIKRCLIAFNILYWFCGPGLLGLTIWFYISMREYQHVIEGTIYQTSCYVLMICGAAAIFIGILGCTGGINENRTVVSAFGILLLCTFGAEIYSVVSLFKFYDTVEDYTFTRLNTSIGKYSTDDSLADDIDSIQRNLQCCGVKGYNSWNNVTIMPNRFIQEGGITYSYPTSCYRQKSIVSKKDTKKLTTPVIVSYEVNQDGCYSKLSSLLKSRLIIIGWGSFAYATYQLFGFVITCCAYKAIKDSYG